MNPHAVARGRSLGYGLLADLCANGLRAATREPARASDALREAIDGRDDDTIAVEHERALGWSAPPFEGAYLDAEGRIGGASTDGLTALFARAGFSPDLRRVDAEHLATSLRALAFLSGAEADAIADGHAAAIDRTRALSRRLLDEHLLRWVPVWAQAVRRVELAFPTALAGAIEELLLAHRAELGGARPRFSLPPLDLDPAASDTDLRAVAEVLVLPARAGLVLGRADLERLGRALSVPWGFGERGQVLVNLLRSSARFEVFDAALDALAREIDAQHQALESERLRSIAALTAPWRERLLETQTVLRVMRAAST